MDVHNPHGPVGAVLFPLLSRSGDQMLSTIHELLEKKWEMMSTAVTIVKAM